MLPESADAISADDIVNLVANQTPERKTLEFKEKLPEGTDKAKKEFLADVCSFANAEGGYIVYGIRERRAADGQPTGIAEAIVEPVRPQSLYRLRPTRTAHPNGDCASHPSCPR